MRKRIVPIPRGVGLSARVLRQLLDLEKLCYNHFPARVTPPRLQGRDMHEPVPRPGQRSAIVWSLLLATCIRGEHAVRISACLFSPLFTTCIHGKHVVTALCVVSSSLCVMQRKTRPAQD